MYNPEGEVKFRSLLLQGQHQNMQLVALRHSNMDYSNNLSIAKFYRTSVIYTSKFRSQTISYIHDYVNPIPTISSVNSAIIPPAGRAFLATVCYINKCMFADITGILCIRIRSLKIRCPFYIYVGPNPNAGLLKITHLYSQELSVPGQSISTFYWMYRE